MFNLTIGLEDYPTNLVFMRPNYVYQPIKDLVLILT